MDYGIYETILGNFQVYVQYKTNAFLKHSAAAADK